ncbi:MAG: serine/threonine-protein kinase [Planctomycetota bacterium]
MTRYSQDDIRRLFDLALDTKGKEREQLLQRECGGDEELKQRVLTIVRAAEDDGFLGDVTAEAALTESPAPDGVPSPVPASRQQEFVGQQIDRFKLLEQLGEGGFGSVWAAEQKEPVKRRVALKIIKLGMDTKQVIARFEAERQALAMMDHPNIAKVLDAGATETGRPFFVMELVRGVPILEYCDTERLGTRERLGLFTQVCNAIQHAHQKGIIHRDIKPNNVLVTLHDSVPVVKVIDFGIAKATNQELTEKTIYTQHRQMIGTPAYMSPEQAEMSGLDIDTRSDIYSLGVLLYELLTGTTPFTEEELGSAGYDGMMRMIREVEPHKPSTRLSTLGATATETADQRRADVQKLGALLRGDIDWIVMKCLEKDRTRRYETANGLATDLQRHLHDEPVLAGPPSSAYRVRKFVRRNRAPVTVAGLFILLAVGAVAGLTGLYFRAESAREDAHNQYIAAQQARLDTELLNSYFLDMFGGITWGTSSSGEIKITSESTVHDVIQRAMEMLPIRFEGRPLLEVEARIAIEAAIFSTGNFEGIPDQSQDIVRLYREAGLPEGDPRLLIAEGLAALYDTSLPMDERLRVAMKKEAAVSGLVDVCHERYRNLCHLIGGTAFFAGQFEDTIEFLTPRVGLCEDGSISQIVRDFAGLDRVFLANALRRTGRFEEAIRQLEIVLNSDPKTFPGLSRGFALLTTARLYGAHGIPGDAVEYGTAGLEEYRSLLGVKHAYTASWESSIATFHLFEGQSAEAVRTAHDALAVVLDVFGSDSTETYSAHTVLALTLLADGQIAEAERALEGLPDEDDLTVPMPFRDPSGEDQLRHKGQLAAIARMKERPKESLEVIGQFLDEVEGFDLQGAPLREAGVIVRESGYALAALGRIEEAEAAFTRARAMVVAADGEQAVWARWIDLDLGKLEGGQLDQRKYLQAGWQTAVDPERVELTS